MKSKILKLLTFLVFIGLLTGCINFGLPQGMGPNGGIFYSYKFGTSASGNLNASKEGKACVNRFFIFVAAGDASIKEAAASAGIKRIASVNKEGFGILSVYNRLCTVVRGD